MAPRARWISIMLNRKWSPAIECLSVPPLEAHKAAGIRLLRCNVTEKLNSLVLCDRLHHRLTPSSDSCLSFSLPLATGCFTDRPGIPPVKTLFFQPVLPPFPLTRCYDRSAERRGREENARSVNSRNNSDNRRRELIVSLSRLR